MNFYSILLASSALLSYDAVIAAADSVCCCCCCCFVAAGYWPKVRTTNLCSTSSAPSACWCRMRCTQRNPEPADALGTAKTLGCHWSMQQHSQKKRTNASAGASLTELIWFVCLQNLWDLNSMLGTPQDFADLTKALHDRGAQQQQTISSSDLKASTVAAAPYQQQCLGSCSSSCQHCTAAGWQGTLLASGLLETQVTITMQAHASLLNAMRAYYMPCALLYMLAGMWVMLDIVPNHAGYFAPENIHEMTFTKPEYYHSCDRECLLTSSLSNSFNTVPMFCL